MSAAGKEEIGATMAAVHLIGHGGLEKLIYRTDIPVPQPGIGEVLIKVAAAGVNNTDINTRIGWYSKVVSKETNDGAEQGFGAINDDDATWGGKPLEFPRIQGADVCGKIVSVGQGVSEARLGERVLVMNMMKSVAGNQKFQTACLGSELDGGFAQYCKVPACEVFAVKTTLSDEELAAIPCAFSTAENLLHRAQLSSGETVLITGASGGVGGAAVQLAKRRGAKVLAVCSMSKAEQVKQQGAEKVIDRKSDLVKELGTESVDVVVDVVAGPSWGSLLEVLKRGGRYAVAGAIGGPMVELDVRTLYLKDLSFFGCTYMETQVFQNLVGYIEKGEIRPLVSKTYPLEEIHTAQNDFMSKQLPGKLVLIPPPI